MNTTLHERLRDLKRRLLAVGLGASTLWAIAGGLFLLLICMWLDLVLELPPVARIVCGFACLSLALVMAGILARRAWHRVAPQEMARCLDRAAGAKGQIVSGVDLLLRPARPNTTGAAVLTAGLAQIAVQRAASLAARIPDASAAPARPIRRPAAAMGGVVLVVLIIAVSIPRLFSTQWLRFFDPFGDHPPYSRIEFSVDPGDAKVIYGSALDIRATPRGETVDSLDLVVKALDGAGEEALPMFPEAGGTWRGTLTNVRSGGRYFVRTHGARSSRFSISVITVPNLEAVRFRITPPAYTNRPPLEGPLPQGGLAALPGTLVQVWARSNRPLSGGMLESDTAQNIAAGSATTRPESAMSFAFRPASIGDNEVTGSFVVRSAGHLRLKVSDVNGQESNDSFTAPITLLRDERPFVRILDPKPDSFATPDITLNVEIQAEDDYGISRLELFRSLDESSATSTVLPVGKPEPTRLPATVPLPLAAYSLSPGDVVKLYARVEDNDPAGPKGSESPVVTVHIISNEQMQQMMLAREGLEVLLSKYEQATRRMEAANEKLEQLRKEVAKADPGSELARNLREQINDAAGHFARDAEKLAGLSAEDLPFDLDHALKKHLDEAAQAMEKATDALDKLAAKPGVSAAAAGQALAEVQKQLGGEREQFKQDAADPLDHLARIYPLIEDQAKFVELWERQKDLADRMASLNGHDNEDDPHLKSRMRDLETEQRQLQSDLRDLLDDIENNTAALPPDARLDTLRETAAKFAKAVRQSTASDEMAASVSGLTEFSGSFAALASRTAANTLEKFLSKCQGIGEEGATCLKFQPGLSASLGDTVEQLLEAEGLGMGKGQKGWAGGSGGYSARRGSLRNVGLYGHIPVRGHESRAGGGHADHGLSTDGSGEGSPGHPIDASSKGNLSANGQSDAAVPERYKSRVGEYFQRVADELDQK